MAYPLDLGRTRFPGTAPGGSEEAQTLADLAYVQHIGYNHEEALRLYEAALARDPAFALARWGVANCLIANYNNPDGLDEARAKRETSEALDTVRLAPWPTYSAVEVALITALDARFGGAVDTTAEGGRAEAQKTYVDAMRTVYKEHKEDPDVVSVFAEAIMMLAPWALWERSTNGEVVGPSISETLEAEAALESALKDHPDHPYLTHLYCHLEELSPHPERAVPAADSLAQGRAVPGQGHLLHMGSHIYMWTGQYDGGRSVF
jgi:tetratricopeptide (TPR) repeat protein